MENNVSCSLCGNELTVTVDGEIDHHSARKIRRKIDEMLYFYRPKTVSLDLSSIAFMDSSGLGLILGRFTLARELGGELRVVNPCENVKKILDLAGTSRLLKVEYTEKKGTCK